MNTTPIGLFVLVAFSLAFAAICVWALWPANRQRLNALGSIPLNEDSDYGQD